MLYNNNYSILKLKNNLIMNLIYNKEFYQDKDHLEKYLNVLVILIKNNMQLKCYNLNKEILILMKYKLLKIL